MYVLHYLSVVIFIATFCKIVAAVSESNKTQPIPKANSCPLWFVFSNTSNGKGCSRCVCREDYGDVVTCDEKLQESYLRLGQCMTYNGSCSDEQDSDAVSFGACPYVYYNNRVNRGYITLPHNISDLNNVFCAPLNREGLLCRDCIDGFGPSIISIGYACANCTEGSYGWLLYILSEFVPATVFYFVILTLRIRITSAPMNCFIMFSQLTVNRINEGQGLIRSTLMAGLDRTSRAVFKVILTGYGFWNLDFFHYLIPPFCVSRSLKNIHVLALQYVSAFYPLLLIALTYTCVELHGHNFRPIVWLWKPFHRCFVYARRRWDAKASLIDVFATFLLLSYSKLLFVSLYLLQETNIYNADGELVPGTSNILLVDATVRYLSAEHLPFAIISFLILVFTFLPPLVLIFYPCKVFSRCPNRCHKRRWYALHTFVEAFHGCYKDGITDEGRDFRHMSGMYMLLRFLVIIVNYHVVDQVAQLLRVMMFLSLSILMLIVQPYKKRYMNVLDGLLLALMGFLTLVIITSLYILPSANKALALISMIAGGIPQLVLLLSVTYTQLKGKQIVRCITGKVATLLKQLRTRNQADELSDADSLPHRLVSPNQYNRSLLSESERTHTNSETLSVRGQVPPVYTYGSIS